MPYRNEHISTQTEGTRTVTIEKTVHISGSSGRASEPYFSVSGTDMTRTDRMWLPPAAETLEDAKAWAAHWLKEGF